jgi:hypothetical protein
VPVTKSYAVLELGQEENTPKPKWDETMTALFGDHVQWDEVKVYSTKNRPLCEYHPNSGATSRANIPSSETSAEVPFDWKTCAISRSTHDGSIRGRGSIQNANKYT